MRILIRDDETVICEQIKCIILNKYPEYNISIVFDHKRVKRKYIKHL